MANDALAACQAANRRSILQRRKLMLGLCAAPFALTACEAKTMNGTFEVVIFSYLNRPIFDVLLDGFDVGVAGAWEGNFTGGGSMFGVTVKYGPHKVSWRLGGPEGMPRNGETVYARNVPVLERPPREHRFLCLHIYPDDSVELLTSQSFPDKTARGIAMGDALRNAHGK